MTWNLQLFFSMYLMFTAIVHVPVWGRHRVTVEHGHSDGDNGDNTQRIDNMSPATEPLAKG